MELNAETRHVCQNGSYVKLDIFSCMFLIRVGAPQGFWGSGEKGYLFSGSWGALLIILGELGSKHILSGI